MGTHHSHDLEIGLKMFICHHSFIPENLSLGHDTHDFSIKIHEILHYNVLQGFVSPLISNGLAAMSQFEITLPQIRRINVTAAENGTENQSRMLHYLHLLNESDDV